MNARESQRELTRREFLRVAASAGIVGAGAVLLGGCGAGDGDGSATSTPGIVIDPPPETTTIRLRRPQSITLNDAAVSLAEQFLPAEGFTDVRYVDVPFDIDSLLLIGTGEMDIDLAPPSSVVVAADRGGQLVVLAGVVNSVFELFGNDRVQSLRDLKGKRIWITKRDASSPDYALWAALLAYVGIDLEHEVEFVELGLADIFPAIQEGRIDVFLSIRPNSTALRKGNVGHVFLDGAADPPWSQYFGQMVAANGDFAEKQPAATKRALRAILRATDMCAREPEAAARYLVDKGFTPYTYEEALAALTAVSYAAWREFNPEDTMRFYALRLKEAGLIKSTPDELIARATDWRYLDEIKRELGAP